jgi:GntR family transcriptional regulator
MRLRTGPIPLYFQLEHHLRERIEAGEFRGGRAFPTEERLCHEYGVSRITVRRALDGLLAAGLISRRRGVRTFVVDPVQTVKSVTLVGSLDDIAAPAKALSHTTLSRRTVAASPLVAQTLELAEAARVLRLETIVFSGGEAFAYGEFFFPEDVATLLGDTDVDGLTPIALVERKLGQRIVRARQSVDPALADGVVAKALGVKPKAAVLRVVRTYYAGDGRAVETAVMRYHPERYRYTVQLVPQPRMPA